MRSILRRAGWIFLAVLFLGTGLGVGVVAFWQATHQDKDSNSLEQQQTCALGAAPNVSPQPIPEPFKPNADVTQLQITDIKEGTGKAAVAGDCLIVKYYGTLASDGTKFDEDYSSSDGLKLQIGVGEVIAGWDQGLIGMKVGGTRRLVIPSELAYGSQSSGLITANSDLVFEVYLDSVQ